VLRISGARTGLASRLVKAVGRVLGENTTTRNWATVMKLHGQSQ